MAQDPHYKGWALRPGDLLTVEVHNRDGTTATVVGTVDRVPVSAANLAMRLVLRDAETKVE